MNKNKFGKVSDVAICKLHVRRGDKVRIISGDDKGKEGVIISVMPKRYKAVVEGMNIMTCHIKPNAQNSQKGGTVKKEAPMHISKLMLVEKSTGQPTRIGRKIGDSGRLERFSKKTGNFI
jgi:large subunit ribosomal protein L24